MKTALIFGHSSGLGRELTQQLLDNDYRVVGFARKNCSIDSQNLINISADLSKKEALEAAINVIYEKYNNFDLLIFTAGTLTAHFIDQFNYEEMEYSFKVNAFAPMFLESHLLNLIRKNSADIVNITSSSLVDYYPKFSEYSTSKAALAKFTADLKKELASTSSRVIDVCPSGFTSNIYKSMTGDKINRDESRQMKSSDLATLIINLLGLPKIMEVSHIYVDRK